MSRSAKVSWTEESKTTAYVLQVTKNATTTTTKKTTTTWKNIRFIGANPDRKIIEPGFPLKARFILIQTTIIKSFCNNG